MKHVLFCLILLFGILLSACGQERSGIDPADYEHPAYTSSIDKAECYLCGERTDCTLSAYWGQENVGLLDLNTFEVLSLPINTYGPDGQHIKKPQGAAMFTCAGLGEIHVTAFTDPDRGSSRVDIPERGEIDPEAIGSHLCQDCLDTFGAQFFVRDEPSEIAVVDFATRDLRPLVASCLGFGFDVFSVDCDYETDGSINLLVYYSPPRFQGT